MKESTERMRRRAREKKAAGLCYSWSCQKPPSGGTGMCEEHRARALRSARRYSREVGMPVRKMRCKSCGHPGHLAKTCGIQKAVAAG